MHTSNRFIRLQIWHSDEQIALLRPKAQKSLYRERNTKLGKQSRKGEIVKIRDCGSTDYRDWACQFYRDRIIPDREYYRLAITNFTPLSYAHLKARSFMALMNQYRWEQLSREKKLLIKMIKGDRRSTEKSPENASQTNPPTALNRADQLIQIPHRNIPVISSILRFFTPKSCQHSIFQRKA